MRSCGQPHNHVISVCYLIVFCLQFREFCRCEVVFTLSCCQTNFRQLSDNHQLALGSQSAGSWQADGKELAGSHPEVMKLSFFHFIAQPLGLKAFSVLFVMVTVLKMAFWILRGKPNVKETFCHGGKIVCFALKMRFLSTESNTWCMNSLFLKSVLDHPSSI